MKPRFDPAGRTALVTGASSGIGLALATALARTGARLVLTARRRQRLEELADSIVAQGGEPPLVVGADLMSEDGARRVFAAAESGVGAIDLLVNNAGVGRHGDFHVRGLGAAEQILRLNVMALQRLTSLALPGMIARSQGAVLNVASIAATAPLPRMATYAASKAWVLSFSEALHHELRPHGVLVTCLCPGVTGDTEFGIQADYPRHDTDWREHLRLPAHDVARAALAGLRGGKMTVAVGGRNRALMTIARLLPRALLAYLTARRVPRQPEGPGDTRGAARDDDRR